MAADDAELERLRRELAQKDAELTMQTRGLTALQAIAEATRDAPSVDQVFARTLRVLGNLTGYTHLALRLYISQFHCLRLMAQIGMEPSTASRMSCLSAASGVMANVFQEKKPAVTTSLPWPDGRPGAIPGEVTHLSVACIPLLAADRLVGTMEFAMPEEHVWAENELQWLAFLGRIVGVNVQHVQLADQLHSLAVAHERTRLAQEMHDGLGQTIGCIRVWAEEAQLALEEADAGAALKAVEKIDSAARDAYDTLREEVLGLRMALGPGETILPVLRRFLDRFHRQWNIVTDLRVPAGLEDRPLRIGPAQEIQMLRVVQEAMTNVRRHADAGRAVVSIEDRPSEILVTVEDDGKGFELAAVSEEQLGLRIMRERITGVCGQMQISSQAGHGTRLEFRLPKSGPILPEESDHVPSAPG